MELADYEEGGNDGKQGIINIGAISAVFEPDAVVTIAALKELGLINKKVQRIKILADGILDKPLTVKAEAYSVQAIKMIELTGGKVIILRSPKEMERLQKLREQTQPID
jgi:large subunit ribosomal protein L15